MAVVSRMNLDISIDILIIISLVFTVIPAAILSKILKVNEIMGGGVYVREIISKALSNKSIIFENSKNKFIFFIFLISFLTLIISLTIKDTYQLSEGLF